MLSILIPVWNQGEKIKDNFLNLIDVLKEIKDEYEIIFVDDGSTDNTFTMLQNIQNGYSNIKIIRQKHLGQHAALFEGFKRAKGDIIITMDADQNVEPKYIPRLLDKINQGDDIVVSWRVSRPGLRLVRRMCSLLVNHYTNFITGTRLHDHACSLKAYRGQLVKENLCRKELRRFFGILIVRYANRISEIKVLCNYKYSKNSSFTFKGLLLLLFDFIFSSINMRYRNILSGLGKS